MNDTQKRFSKLFEGARKRIEYFIEGAILEFTESVVSRMETLKVTKSDLAKRLTCKPSYVTKILRGATNFTLESMVRIASALDCDLSIKLIPKRITESFPVREAGSRISRTSGFNSTRTDQYPLIKRVDPATKYSSVKIAARTGSVTTQQSHLKGEKYEFTFSTAA